MEGLNADTSANLLCDSASINLLYDEFRSSLSDLGECRRMGVAGLRYDSVTGIHPHHNTPIFVTYNSGHAYPKYLITYTRI